MAGVRVMTTVDIRRFNDTFVIHFGGEHTRINAYTLATALVGIADAAKAANAVINTGHEIEVVVEALAVGSFKATVRAIYTSAGNLFSKESVKSIVLGVIASYIYQHTLAPKSEVVVEVHGDEVIVEHGDTRIVVPRIVHEATQQMERSPGFGRGVSDAIRAINSDPKVTSIGLSPDQEIPEPPVKIPREHFAALLRAEEEVEDDERERLELTDLRIMRAILERSRRKWEFVWNGVRISAPVVDDAFYDRFFAHRITVAPGDVLHARLRIRQRRKPDVNVFINESYEVVEVVEHRPAMRQPELSGKGTDRKKAGAKSKSRKKAGRRTKRRKGKR